mgnify:FL=1
MQQPDKALDNKLTIKRKRIMSYFIEAAEKLIRTEGLDGLSIRKIAGEAGYNSATIYNYFNDLEQLALFGSVCYLREYVAMLEQEWKPDMRAIDQYRTIYHCFNCCVFRSPEIYYNMFFGKYSHRLGSVLKMYYQELFPGELDHLSPQMRQIMMGGNMLDRDRITMEKMVQEGDVAPEKAEDTMELIIALHQSFIYEAVLDKEHFDIQARNRRFDQLFEYLLAAAK